MQEGIKERIGMLLRAIDKSIVERRLDDAATAAEAIGFLCGSLANLAWSSRPSSGDDSSERGW